MDSLNIQGTKDTPSVLFIKDKGILMIAGRSIPENPILFYTPILDEVKEFAKGTKALLLSLELEYMNTSSAKFLKDIIRTAKEGKGGILVTWIYEEDDEKMLETGKYLEEMLQVPFEFRETL